MSLKEHCLVFQIFFKILVMRKIKYLNCMMISKCIFKLLKVNVMVINKDWLMKLLAGRTWKMNMTCG